MQAGTLRHRITIEARVDAPDADGDITTTWQPFAENVPAQIEPLSARELLASGADQSALTTRITIRYLDGITAKMRARRESDGRLYNIAVPIEDNRSGREWITLLATSGMNDG